MVFEQRKEKTEVLVEEAALQRLSFVVLLLSLVWFIGVEGCKLLF